uniref:LEAF RUST 10 DISEASE-RESISTANCE LOCUS RECEPTOR-LIKE PROTEIN KINASE-like 2.4 isoform X2 n=1 Tax=Erigeron canadensis TaxID=72917 RepID=UPI001CB9CC7D|nr:LEAF RUST 10 DISEASE-RESISTANCE LOCUS RECEPTOR-LIKE PROTEIN KINASE-like 2.4 isoform X2 [Erigeron canadensis]
MIKLHTKFFMCCIFILPFITSQEPTHCIQSCPGGKLTQVPYPFGFSPGCEVQLNCTSNGTVMIDEFPVQEINPDDLVVTLPTTCGRPISSLGRLYSNNYALTSTSAILMENCTDETTNCNLPVPLPQFRSAIVNCSSVGYGNMSCYVGDVRTSMFLDYGNLTSLECKFLLTGFVSRRIGGVGPPPSMTRAVNLGWWVKGACNCSDGADCMKISSPTDGSDGYRCMCRSGFHGDGYKASSGCLRGVLCGTVGTVLLLFVILYVKKGELKTQGVVGRHKTSLFGGSTRNHQIEKFISNYGNLAPKRFTYKEIKKMTKPFPEKLGQGGYGSVYKGQLPDGKLVAVKLQAETRGDGEDFINEVASISRTSHVNIVTLLGFCIDGEKRALMYEFMPNGSLDKFLHEDGSRLDWNTLFLIAKGIARGLEYLHQGCNTRIVHFDIKPHNILLDEEFIPKISDFGLAKLCKRKESIMSVMGARGTAGYMAPEVFFRSLGGASHKSDVYSYGMMVLEMTGVRKRNNANMTSSNDGVFPEWIYKQVEAAGNLEDYGVTTEEEEKLARKMMILSLWCIQSDPSARPSTSKVVEMLEGSFESLQVPPRHFRSFPTKPPEGASPLATQSSTSERLLTMQTAGEDFSS